MEAKEKIFVGLIRRCLTQRYLLRSRAVQTFTLLERHQSELQSYFQKMGARLEVNPLLGVAYLASDPELDLEIDCQLGRRKKLAPAETLGLIKLRAKRMEFFAGSIESDTPFVARDELRDFLREFYPELEERKFEQQFNAVTRALEDHRLIIERDNGHYEITPVCDVVLSGDQINLMLDRAKSYFGVDLISTSGVGGTMSSGTEEIVQ